MHTTVNLLLEFQNKSLHTMSYSLYELSDSWSSPTFRGTRPPPCAGFTLTSIDGSRAVFFGGYDAKHCCRISDIYIIDFHTMVH